MWLSTKRSIMKSIVLSLLVISLISITAYSQDKAKDKKGVKKEGAHQAEYNSNTEERDHAADIDSRNATKGANDENVNDVGEQEANENADDAQSETNTAGVPSRDVSSSGSPGVAAEGALDGTNTVQRAKLNTAGSPIPGSSKSAAVRSAANRKAAASSSEAASKSKQAQPKASKDEVKSKKKKPA